MILLLGGAISFLLQLAADWCDARGRRGARILLSSLAFALFAVSLCAATLSGTRFALPLALKAIGGLLSLAALGLLVNSLFLETSLMAPRSAKTLVTRGSYALCRHPGVLWLALLQAGLLLLSASLLLLPALPLWTAFNILLVSIEDRVFLPRFFGDAYRRYASDVPFLLPTPASLRRFLASPNLHIGKGENSGKND